MLFITVIGHCYKFQIMSDNNIIGKKKSVNQFNFFKKIETGQSHMEKRKKKKS